MRATRLRMETRRFLLGLLQPGLGFLIAGRPRVAVVLLVGFWAWVITVPTIAVFLLGPTLAAVAGSATVVLFTLVAQALLGARPAALRPSPPSNLAVGAFVIATLVATVVLNVLLRTSVVSAYQLPTVSMEPAYPVGSHVFVSRLAYGVLGFGGSYVEPPRVPDRGDVVVVRLPVEEIQTRLLISEALEAGSSHPSSDAESGDLWLGPPGTTDAWGRPIRLESPGDAVAWSDGADGQPGTPDDVHSGYAVAITRGNPNCLHPSFAENPAQEHIKRVVGVPGDVIEITDGALVVNGVAVEREQTRALPNDITRYRELLPGSTPYEIQVNERFLSSMNDVGPLTVRDGYVFVLGDFRSNSADSSCWGEVPVELVMGQVGPVWLTGGP